MSRVVVRSAAVQQWGRMSARAISQPAADAVAAEARRLAPRRSGRGPASIAAEYNSSDGGFHIGYGERQSYMGLQEVGTRRTRPHAFLRPALNVIRR